MPKISVIIPVYNVEKYIRECLESIVNQSFTDLEIICVDDCGQDNSISIVEEYCRRDKRVRLIKHDKNKGIGAARNTATKQASGKYVYFIDSDDYADLQMLENVYNKLEQSGFESAWVATKVYYEEKKAFAADSYFKNLINLAEGAVEITPENINDFPVLVCNKVFSLDFIKNNDFYFPEGLLHEDEEFYYKFYTKSLKTYFIAEPLCVYRRRKGSVMQNHEAGVSKRADILQVALNIYNYFIETGLMTKYRQAFLYFVFTSIRNSFFMPAYRKKMVVPSQKLLSKINFPEDFNDIRNSYYDFLLFFKKYDQSKIIRNALYKLSLFIMLTAVRFIPFSQTRRAYRKKLNKYYF